MRQEQASVSHAPRNAKDIEGLVALALRDSVAGS